MNSWSAAARRIGVKFVPFALPGFNRNDDPEETVKRDLSKWSARLRIAKKYLDPELKLMILTSFNEWFENTYVEPSTNEKFDYLQATRGAISS